MRQLRVLPVILLMSFGLFAAENPFSGRWKLDVGKSKLPPPAPTAETDVIVADENGIKLTANVTDDKGKPSTLGFEAKFDGKDYPVTGDPNIDSISYHRVNANTLKYVLKKDGKTTGTATAIVSKDGKTATVNFTDYSQAKPISGSEVFERQ